MRAMTAPACDREHRGIAGSRDLRMLPVAAGVWSATLLTRWVCSQHGSGHDVFWQHGRMLQMACLAVASAAIFIALVLIPLTMNGAGKHHGLAVDRAHRMLYTLLTVCFAILAATLATAARSLTEHADPVNMSASSSTERVNLTFTAHSLPLATSMGGYDCQVDGNARSIVRHDVRRPSSRGVRVFARQPACGRIAQQGDYAIVGTIQAAAYGEMPIWVLADGDMMAVKEPPAPWRAVHRIRMAFLQTTRGLDNPGVVLVPGVTLGVLGHDAMVHCADGGVEDEYAELLQEQCRRAGIMHLMAVSGGHYALVGTLVMGLGARLHWNRFVKAGALAMVYPMLTMVLAPSRSVTRAMLMSMLSLGFLMLGRRRQSVHLLCLTVVFGLLLDPSLASSYGFALSCAAVFGLSTACTRMRHGCRICYRTVWPSCWRLHAVHSYSLVPYRFSWTTRCQYGRCQRICWLHHSSMPRRFWGCARCSSHGWRRASHDSWHGRAHNARRSSNMRHVCSARRSRAPWHGWRVYPALRCSS